VNSKSRRLADRETSAFLLVFQQKSHVRLLSTLKVIGGRWKVLIIHFLLDDKQRFGELTRLLGAISARTLSKQLREFEDDGVVAQIDYGEIPPKVEYSLTPLDKALEPILLAMEVWGLKVNQKGAGRGRQSRGIAAATVASGRRWNRGILCVRALG
jgi:DNA-binding HxlR family transcriptional regulator